MLPREGRQSLFDGRKIENHIPAINICVWLWTILC